MWRRWVLLVALAAVAAACSDKNVKKEEEAPPVPRSAVPQPEKMPELTPPAPEGPEAGKKTSEEVRRVDARAAQETSQRPPGPRSIVARSLEAHGGALLLRQRLSASSISYEGKMGDTPYAMTTHRRAPDSLVDDTGPWQPTSAWSGDDCWKEFGDVVVDCSDEQVKNGRAHVFLAHMMTLYPLADPEMDLLHSGETTVEFKRCDKIIASSPRGPMPVIFCFDRTTGLLLKVEATIMLGEAAANLVIEPLDYQDHDGIQVAMRRKMYLTGKLIADEKITTMILGTTDEARFARPAARPVGRPMIRTLPAHARAETTVRGPYKLLKPTILGLTGFIYEMGLWPWGPPAAEYTRSPADTDNPDDYVTELWMPVGSYPGLPEGGDEYGLRKVPEMEIASRLELGPDSRVAKAYDPLAKWVEEQGHEIAGPAGAIFYNVDQAPECKQLTEVYFPILKKTAVEE